jgi:uncharacterized membrane protein YgaE (UPF0421/DUF939 family)
MKLNQENLKTLIRESLQELKLAEQDEEVPEPEQEGDPTKIKQGSMSAGAHKKSSLSDIADTADEFTNQERNIVAQMQSFISDVAAAPGVDLMRIRPMLQRALKLVHKSAETLQNQATQTNQGEK